jgi:hypothetical protein
VEVVVVVVVVVVEALVAGAAVVVVAGLNTGAHPSPEQYPATLAS